MTSQLLLMPSQEPLLGIGMFGRKDAGFPKNIVYPSDICTAFNFECYLGSLGTDESTCIIISDLYIIMTFIYLYIILILYIYTHTHTHAITHTTPLSHLWVMRKNTYLNPWISIIKQTSPFNLQVSALMVRVTRLFLQSSSTSTDSLHIEKVAGP